jgi:hypothetical protein
MPTRYIYRTEVIPGKISGTRIKPFPLANGHGRYMTVTPERTLASVGELLLHFAFINLLRDVYDIYESSYGAMGDNLGGGKQRTTAGPLPFPTITGVWERRRRLGWGIITGISTKFVTCNHFTSETAV